MQGRVSDSLSDKTKCNWCGMGESAWATYHMPSCPMGDASTRKDEAGLVTAERPSLAIELGNKTMREMHEAMEPRSEISVLSIIEDAKKDYANFKKQYPDPQECFHLIGFEIPDFLEYLRGYALRESKPVSVSLGKCAMALQGNERIRLGADLQAIAKTVLDAAGVGYVD